MLVKDKYEVVYYYRVNEIASIFGIFYDKDKMLHKISTYVLHLFFYKISEYRNNKIKEILYDE